MNSYQKFVKVMFLKNSKSGSIKKGDINKVSFFNANRYINMGIVRLIEKKETSLPLFNNRIMCAKEMRKLIIHKNLIDFKSGSYKKYIENSDNNLNSAFMIYYPFWRT